MDADKNEALRASVEMQRAALVVLLDQAGGRASYTEADYQAVAEKYGGTLNLAIHVEVVKTGDSAPTVELQLIRKAPAQGSLVS
jgi:hypothetical protein